jgi:hypothetical protein
MQSNPPTSPARVGLMNDNPTIPRTAMIVADLLMARQQNGEIPVWSLSKVGAFLYMFVRFSLATRLLMNLPK